MAETMILKEKKTRASASKARTGCITCKKRHVKCDEAKPSCNRCLSGGRKCQGYSTSTNVVHSLDSMTVYFSPTQNPTRFASDFSQIDYYQAKVAAQLSGYWDSKFWTTLVMQLSHSEPAIQHALNAMTRAVQRSEEIELGNLRSILLSKDSYYLRECNVAMRCLSKRIEQDPTCHLVPLVTCLLFICLEFIQGTVDSAMVHIRSGFNILKSREQSKANNVSLSDSSAVEMYIIPIFERLNLLCALFGGHGYITESTNLDKCSNEFFDMMDAEQQFHKLMIPTIKFIRIVAHKANFSELELDDYIQHANLQKGLYQLTDSLKDLLIRLRIAGKLTKADETAADILFMHQKCIFIWLSVCVLREECSVDAYTAIFKDIVEIGSRIISQGQSNSNQFELGKYTFEMQIIGPLYYTAIKCRIPSIRRHALDLLQLAPRREGLWDSRIAAKVSERIIQIEEKNLNVKESSISDQDVFLPLESDRIYFVNELPGEFRKIYDSDMPDRIESVFTMKPWGINGEWHNIKEEIYL